MADAGGKASKALPAATSNTLHVRALPGHLAFPEALCQLRGKDVQQLVPPQELQGHCGRSVAKEGLRLQAYAAAGQAQQQVSVLLHGLRSSLVYGQPCMHTRPNLYRLQEHHKSLREGCLQPSRAQACRSIWLRACCSRSSLNPFCPSIHQKSAATQAVVKHCATVQRPSPHLAAWRTALSIRAGSSWKDSAGLPMVRSTRLAQSLTPPV